MSMMTSKCIQLHCVLIKIEEEISLSVQRCKAGILFTVHRRKRKPKFNTDTVLSSVFLFLSRAERAIKNRATVRRIASHHGLVVFVLNFIF